MRLVSRLRIIFGFLYFLLHVFILLFAAAYIVLSLTVAPAGPEVIVIVLVPLLGMFAGFSIWKGRFGAWRVAAIVGSMVISLLAVCAVALIPSVLKPPQKTIHPKTIQPTAINTAANARLIAAVRNSDWDAAELALTSGADIRARTEFGETVLHLVRSPVLAQFLISQGADINAREAEFQMTPIFNQDVGIAALLYNAGADINIKAKNDMTPLMWHAYSNHLAGVKFLATRGARVNAVNKEDSTALDIALRFGYQETAGYLRSLGGKTAEELKR